MKIRILSLILLLLLSSIAIADVIDQDATSCMPPPVGDDGYGIAGIVYARWEGQQFAPVLPLLTAVDFGVLSADHSWNTLPDGEIVEARIYENDGGIPTTLLATKAMAMPASDDSIVAGKSQLMTYKFVFDTPLDVSAYVGIEAPLTVVFAVPNNTYPAGELSTIHDPSPSYPGGMRMVSYDQGANWNMDGSKDQVFRTYGIEDPFRAKYPVPATGSTVDKIDGSTLLWEAGITAVTHEVYWSNVLADVTARTITPITLTVAIDGNTIPAPGSLTLGETYYWAVDEIDSGAQLYAGPLWSYNIEDFVRVDDMEDYGMGTDVKDIWVDGNTTNNGAAVGEINPGLISTIQGMEYQYSNNGTNPVYGHLSSLYYSEVVADTGNLDCGSDWTVDNLAWLRIQFKGNPDNDKDELMYVAIEDGSLNFAMVQYGITGSYPHPVWVEDANNLQTFDTHQWGIDLRRFSGVNLDDVQKVYIGFGQRGLTNNGSRSGSPDYSGTVVIDEINVVLPGLYGDTPKILVEDVYSDGVINLKDLAVLANRYLEEEDDGTWPIW